MKEYGLNMLKAGVALALVLAGTGDIQAGGERRVKIVEPANGAVLKGSFKICMEVENLILEPADNGVREGHGHHHIMFSSLPTDLSKPIGKKQAIHYADGLACHTLQLVPGKHVLTALFAYGDHVPYNPPITDKIAITVE